MMITKRTIDDDVEDDNNDEDVGVDVDYKIFFVDLGCERVRGPSLSCEHLIVLCISFQTRYSHAHKAGVVVEKTSPHAVVLEASLRETELFGLR